MKLALLTNMPSYHQVELGAQIAALLGEENFRLVFSDSTSDSREEMGWSDRYKAPYILRMWQSEDVRQEVCDWIQDADVVVQGRFPMDLVRARINSGKLTFAYQERFWKRSFSWGRVVMRLPRIWRRYWSVNKTNYHLLAAGAYVAPDLSIIGCFKNRAWKFGYFIDHKEMSRAKSGQSLTILWCARFSPVKRVEDAIAIFKGLTELRQDLKLLMVGDGEEREKAQALAKPLGEAVTFLGWQSSEQVAAHMSKADVFLMTSGFGEGWALVINEAVRAGCVVVANREIGAAPWLIAHKKTGLLYEQTNLDKVVEELAVLSGTHIESMSMQARKLHQSIWSAKVAAERLVGLSKALLANVDAKGLYADGPCSSAE